MALPDSVLAHLRRVAAEPDLTGTPYTLEGLLGRGGLGAVYAVQDHQLERRVALKVLHAASDQAARALAEARHIAQLEHPGIPPIHEAGILADGRAYYTMRLVDGEPLQPSAAGSLSDRLRLFQKIADAVAYAHAQGVVHRDLKPANILVGPFGEVFVMDWSTQDVRGTPSWSAPESSRTPAADIYSLGQLLAALLPQDAPRALNAVAQHAAHPDPASRYPNVPALEEEIRRFLDGERVLAHQETLLERTVRLYRRHEVLWLLLAAYVAVRFFLFFWSRT